MGEYVKEYELVGFITEMDWFGKHIHQKLVIHTNEQGLKEIKENPLKDYTGLGVKLVDYACFDVYLIEREKDGVEIKYLDPIDKIEAGVFQMSPEEKDAFMNDSNFLEIPYKL